MQLSALKNISIITVKYGLISAVLLFSLRVLKNLFYISYDSWESYAAVIAVLFLAIGFFINKIYFSPIQTSKVSPQQVLSKREMQVMDLLCQQKTNQQIADELCIELSTLKTHINRIYKKLEVKNRQQLIALVCPPWH